MRWNGQWMPVEDFLRARFGIESTHGVSDEAMVKLLEEAESASPPSDA